VVPDKILSFQRGRLRPNSTELALTEIWPSQPWPKFGRIRMS